MHARVCEREKERERERERERDNTAQIYTMLRQTHSEPCFLLLSMETYFWAGSQPRGRPHRLVPKTAVWVFSDWPLGLKTSVIIYISDAHIFPSGAPPTEFFPPNSSSISAVLYWTQDSCQSCFCNPLLLDCQRSSCNRCTAWKITKYIDKS